MQAIASKIFSGDRQIWLIIVLLCMFSILAVFSASAQLEHRYFNAFRFNYIIKHVVILMSGIGIIAFCKSLDYRFYKKGTLLLAWITIPLLIWTLLFGTEINSAKRWVTVPVVNLTFQASDLAKLALVMFVARGLAIRQEVIKEANKTLYPLIIATGITCCLIITEDLSSTILLLATVLILMFIGRVPFKHMITLVGLGALILALAIAVAFALPDESLRKGRVLTWKNRIESFVTPGSMSFQEEQAKIAIAKGGIVKMNPGGSTQRYKLPHPYSDYIYAIIIEEYGVIGGASLLVLYLWLLLRCIQLAKKCTRVFPALLIIGLALSLTLQSFMNMGVNVGLLPVTGVTLPLISMGGSSIWFTSIALGIILSVSVHALGDKENLITDEVLANQ